MSLQTNLSFKNNLTGAAVCWEIVKVLLKFIEVSKGETNLNYFGNTDYLRLEYGGDLSGHFCRTKCPLKLPMYTSDHI